MASAAAPESTLEMEVDDAQAAPAPLKRTRGESLLDAFGGFRLELDSHYDRRERIIKISRDITALSKKLIFALHRITNQDRKIVMKEADKKLAELRVLFVKLQGEVQGSNFWRYEKSVSPGIQEYLEGLTFYHYLLHHTIPTLAQCQASLLPPPSPPVATAPTTDDATDATLADPVKVEQVTEAPSPYVLVTAEDYLGGIADLTGELMRLAIGSVGRSLDASVSEVAGGTKKVDNSGLASIESIGQLVREIKGEMDPLEAYSRWLNKKLVVLDQSLSKIELTSYNLRIRGAEYAGSPEMMKSFAELREPAGAAVTA